MDQRDALHNTLMEFNTLYKEMDDLYHTVALKLGLSDSAFFILYALYEQGDGCLQREICDAFFLSKQTVNSSIQKLEQEGYLSLHQGNGRDKHIHITPEGRRLLDKKIHPVVELEKQASAPLCYFPCPYDDLQFSVRHCRRYFCLQSCRENALRCCKPGYAGYDGGSCYRLYAFAFLLIGISIWGSSFFTSLGNGLISAAISFLKTLVFEIGSILILPLFLGINGIWLAIVAAELMAAAVTFIFLAAKKDQYHYL